MDLLVWTTKAFTCTWCSLRSSELLDPLALLDKLVTKAPLDLLVVRAILVSLVQLGHLGRLVHLALLEQLVRAVQKVAPHILQVRMLHNLEASISFQLLQHQPQHCCHLET